MSDHAVSQGTLLPLPNAQRATLVCINWAKWERENAPDGADQFAILRKDEVRLVVYRYGPSVCGVLKLADVKPKFRDFRVWREPLERVQQKLMLRGWKFVRCGEVSHGNGH